MSQIFQKEHNEIKIINAKNKFIKELLNLLFLFDLESTGREKCTKSKTCKLVTCKWSFKKEHKMYEYSKFYLQKIVSMSKMRRTNYLIM